VTHRPRRPPAQVLGAGAIPVYLGAPNWREFFPAPDAVIDAGGPAPRPAPPQPARAHARGAGAEFDSPHELAEHLRALLADPARLDALRAWRRRPLPAAARALEAVSFTHNLCRVCRWKANHSGLPHAG
jgi:hypothetical protein